MKVIVGADEIVLGTTDATPTIGLVDFSRRETDDFGVTRVVERGFARRLSVRLAIETDQVDTVQQQLAALRATKAQWVADDQSSWLNFEGFYRDFEIDLAGPSLSFCTLTVEGLAELEAGTDPGGDPAPPESASTLRLLQPIPVTGALLVASSVAEDDHPEWAAGTTYPAGARVIKAATHRIYESASAGNVGNDPAGATGQWIDVGPTNRWAMFDQALGSLTTANGSIAVTLGGAGVNAVALLDVTGAAVRVQASGYDQTQAVTGGALLFFGLPGAGPIVVTVSGPGEVSAGTLIMGAVVDLGVTEASPTAGITDFSRKEADEFGEVTIVERAWAKRMSAQALIRTDALDHVANRIASVRARPSLWIGDEGLDSLTVYGFFRDFSIERGETVSKLALSIEGLSTAGKVEPPTVGVAWPDVTDPDGTKPQDNADVTGENTAADTDKVGGTPAAALLGNLAQIATDLATIDAAFAQVEADIDELFDVAYGEGSSAAASAAAAASYAAAAQQARDDAADAMLGAEQAALDAALHASSAIGSASAAAGSAATSDAHRAAAASYAEVSARSAMALSPRVIIAEALTTEYVGSANPSAMPAAKVTGNVLIDPVGTAPYGYGAWLRGVVPVVAGKTYRVTVSLKSVGSGNYGYFFHTVLDSTFASVAAYTTVIQLIPTASPATWTAEISCDAILAANPGAAWLRSGVLYNRTSGGAGQSSGTGIVTHVNALFIEDVTSEKAAAASATTASTAATTAEGHASASQTARTAAETARGGAEAAQGAAVTARDTAQGHAADAATSSTVAASSKAAAQASALSTVPDNFLDPTLWASHAAWGGTAGVYNGYGWTSNQGALKALGSMPIGAGDTIRLSTRFRYVTSLGVTYLGVMCRNATGAELGIIWSPYQGVAATPFQVWSDAQAELTASLILGTYPTTASVSPILLLGYIGGGHGEITKLRVENVASEKAAGASATAAATSASSASTKADEAGSYATAANQSYINAQTQAGNALTYAGQANDHRVAASNSAAAAQSSAVLSAKLSTKLLTANPSFAEWPVGQVWPTGWTSYGTVAGTRLAAPDGKGNALKIDIAEATTGGVAAYTWGGVNDGHNFVRPGWYVVEVDLRLNAGGLTNIGFYAQGLNAGAAEVQSYHFYFSNLPDQTGVAPGYGVAGKEYSFRKLIQFTEPTVQHLNLFVATFGNDPSEGKHLTLRNAGIRPATQMEIDAGRVVSIEATVSTQASTLATLNSQYASLSNTVSTQGASITTNSNALTTLNSSMASLTATVGAQGSSISTQAVAISNLNNRTSAFWQVTAVAGGRAQMTVYADANGGGGVDIVGDVRIMGAVTIVGIVKANAFVTDQGVDYDAIVPGQLNWKLSAYDPTDHNYGTGVDTGIVAIAGSGRVTTAAKISVAPQIVHNAGQRLVDTNGDGFPDVTYERGGYMKLYYRINGGGWIEFADMSALPPGIIQFSPAGNGTIEFGWRLIGYSTDPDPAYWYVLYERSLAIEVVNWK